ncbi:O-antigen ligase family protein [Clostridium paraputrificum]|uniref:O-antigen ligase family protein n=1 Tax=Clostridium paraputrificum TaxID=29363 RepID=UPI00374EB36F
MQGKKLGPVKKITYTVMVGFVFFSYVLNRYKIIFPMSILTLLMLNMFYTKRGSAVTSSLKYLFPWIFCIYINIIGLIKTTNRIEAASYLCMLLLLILLTYFVDNNVNWVNWIYKLFIVCGGIHAIATILQLIIPKVINKFCGFFLTSGSYSANVWQYNNGKLAGITGQVGANAFYIGILIGIIFVEIKFIENIKKNKIILYILWGITYFALILTTKRGELIFSVLSIIIIYYNGRKKNTKIYISFCIILFILGLVFFFYENNVSIDIVDLNNYSSGRINIYMDTINSIKKSPIIGNGLLITKSLFEINSHNIYLQIFNELGILGLVIYLFTFLYELKKSFSIYNYLIKEKNNDAKYACFSIYSQLFFLLCGFVANPLYDNFMLLEYMISIMIIRAINIKFQISKVENIERTI